MFTPTIWTPGHQLGVTLCRALQAQPKKYLTKPFANIPDRKYGLLTDSHDTNTTEHFKDVQLSFACVSTERFRRHEIIRESPSEMFRNCEWGIHGWTAELIFQPDPCTIYWSLWHYFSFCIKCVKLSGAGVTTPSWRCSQNCLWVNYISVFMILIEDQFLHYIYANNVFLLHYGDTFWYQNTWNTALFNHLIIFLIAVFIENLVVLFCCCCCLHF